MNDVGALWVTADEAKVMADLAALLEARKQLKREKAFEIIENQENISPELKAVLNFLVNNV
jgi:hypothetical protein